MECPPSVIQVIKYPFLQASKPPKSCSLRRNAVLPVQVHSTSAKFPPMSPKLFRTNSHREEHRGIDLAPLFLWLVLLKLVCNQLKIFVNLTFSQKVWPIFLFWFTSCAELRVLWVLQKRCDIFVLLWQTCQIFKVFYLWLKKFDTKVLRRFRRHGEKFTYAPLIKFLPK